MVVHLMLLHSLILEVFGTLEKISRADLVTQ